MKFRKKRRSWFIVLLLLVIALAVFGFSRPRVETDFSTGWYPSFSVVQRNITGWIPFSVGDIIYLIVFLSILFAVIRFVNKAISRKLNRRALVASLGKWVLTLLAVYIIFQSFWGLNYNRQGIAFQLRLEKPRYDTAALLKLQTFLLGQVNSSKEELNVSEKGYPENREIFNRGTAVYHQAAISFPFLQYSPASIKSSLFGKAGNYLGFTGYYNPFTGEAQVNTTVPRFLIPIITAHEMAHQLGYAKENEASFVGYLVSTTADDPYYRYSAYLDLFFYVNAQVSEFDSLSTQRAISQLDEGVKTDIKEWRDFALAHRTFLSKATTWLYGKFLVWFNQPEGIKSYDAVVALVISYYQKQGLL